MSKFQRPGEKPQRSRELDILEEKTPKPVWRPVTQKNFILQKAPHGPPGSERPLKLFSFFFYSKGGHTFLFYETPQTAVLPQKIFLK